MSILSPSGPLSPSTDPLRRITPSRPVGVDSKGRLSSRLGLGLRTLALVWIVAQPTKAWAVEHLPAIACPRGKPDYALALDETFDQLSLRRNGGPGRWSTTADGSNAYQLGNRTLLHERELYTDADAMAALKLPPANRPFRVKDGILSISAATSGGASVR